LHLAKPVAEVFNRVDIRNANTSCPLTLCMPHDRLHARKPTHDIERWSTGIVDAVERGDSHCVVTVIHEDNEPVELVITLAIRDLFLSRLDINDGESSEGELVWYRKHGV